MEDKLLLCTDMDRTIIPNGFQAEDQCARARFKQFCQLDNVMLAYVSGRNIQLVQQAISEYQLPEPDYIIADVGSSIYRCSDGYCELMAEWNSVLESDWGRSSHYDLVKLLASFSDLRLQDTEHQSTYKLSYFVDLSVAITPILEQIQQCLAQNNIKASLVYSIDEPNEIGLLDVLAEQGTKLHAIQFLRQYLSFSVEQTVFAGDSGNDLSVMESMIPSVLVANASDDVKQQAKQQALANNHSETLYCADGRNSDMNGNYAAGVLEGVAYFMPNFRIALKKLGINYDNGTCVR